MLSPRYRIRMCLSLVAFLTLTVSGQSAERAADNSVLIRGVPHVRQKPDFCGEACAEMYLRKLGYRTDQDAVFDAAKLSPLEARGCWTKDLAAALKNIGFDIGAVWYQVPVNDLNRKMNDQFLAMHRDLKQGIPSIICMHYNDQPNTTEHFRLILGYDETRDEILYHEPAEDQGAYRRMSRTMLMKLWPLKYNAQMYTVIRMPLKPGQLRPAKMSSTFTDADYAQHIMKLKKRLPNKDFHIVIQKPFVVVGDEPLATVKQRSVRTIKWAVDRLKQDYFTKDPKHIIDVWLFKDKTSYETNAKALWGRVPGTPYGYYSSTNKVLVMNISTGGGTLVHEIVHPFIESNFPGCPSWFNEGLASLYEACGDRNNQIHGFVNWRLRGLQQAIPANRVPSFKELCSTTTNEFYNEDKGTNYSQARYLCYYLQEKKLLRKFYHEFNKSVKEDPTGYNTLQKVLNERDMDAFKKNWEAYVMQLK